MISGMVLAMAVILGYQMFVTWLWKHNNWKPPGADVATTQISTDAGAPPTTSSDVASGASMIGAPTTGPTTQAAGVHVVGASSIQPATIGSLAANDPTYVMGVHLLSQGAAIDSVALNQFKLKVGQPEPYTFDQPDDFGPDDRALASRNITINGQSIDLANVQWTLEKSSPGEATYAVDIEADGQKQARIHKTYHLDTLSESKATSGGYEMTITMAIDNLGAKPITASTSFNGPLAPRPEISRGPDRNILGGYDNAGSIELNHHAIEELKPENPHRDITKSEKDSKPFVWGGIGGTYFNSIVRPLPPGQAHGVAPYIASVEAESIHIDAQHEHPEVRTTFTTADLLIPANSSTSFQMKLFEGPKARSLLNNAYYTDPLIAYSDTLVMASGMCGYCAIDWLISSLVWLMTFFHNWVFRDWGLAIIALVVLVRLILHPITKKSQVNMMKMSKMGPEMERLKKKYGDDKEAIAKAQMELYKEMGFTPVLGCLPMFLQMPIFISLWQALQSTFELRHASFLWGFTWIKDLSQPDRLFAFSHPIPLIFGWHIDAINVLPVLVAIVSFINMKYTPRPPAATPEAEQQQKMMQWMTLIFPLMFYSFPSGLNIYYLTSTSLGIVEGKRIRAHIKEREEAEKGGKIIVDASPRRRNRSDKDDKPPEPKGLFAGWLAQLQEKAEQMRVEPDKKNRKG